MCQIITEKIIDQNLKFNSYYGLTNLIYYILFFISLPFSKKKGIALQENLREKIEKMLGACPYRAEPLIDTPPKVGKPHFETIDENQDFSPEVSIFFYEVISSLKIYQKII